MYSDFFYDPDNAGVVQWATSVKSATKGCQFKAVAVDGSGNVYAAGFLNVSGVFDFGGNSKEVCSDSGENFEAVLVKYNSSGEAQWVKTVDSNGGNSVFWGVAVDDSDNAYVVGQISYSTGVSYFNFGGKSKPLPGTNSSSSPVIVKYNSDGEAQWATSVDFAEINCVFNCISINCGNIYAVGNANLNGDNGIDFGGNSSSFDVPSGGDNAIIVKYDLSGTAQWATSVKVASSTSGFNAVAADRNGNAYAVGSVTGTMSGEAEYSFSDSSDIFHVKYEGNNAIIVKYNASGIAEWATPIESAEGGSCFNGVAVDRFGNASAVGNVDFSGKFDFGGESIAFAGKVGSQNAVIVKYDSSGTAQWAAPIHDSSGSCCFNGVAVDAPGNLYATGNVTGTGIFDFGGNSVPFNGKTGGCSAVIVKYNPSGSAQWVVPVNESDLYCNFRSVAVDHSGYSYAAGYVQAKGSYDFGGKSVPFNGQPSGDGTVVVKYY